MFQAGECTYPIYYQRVVNVDKGSVIIRYKLPELIKTVSLARSSGPALPQPMFQALTMAGSRTLPSRSHVSSTTGGCTYPIHYQRVVSVDRGGEIIRDKKNKLAYQKKFLRGGEPSAILRPCFKHN